MNFLLNLLFILLWIDFDLLIEMIRSDGFYSFFLKLNWKKNYN